LGTPPPQAAGDAAAVTGARFAAVECGWGAKSGALARIAADLSIGTDALAFVDDDPYERAEVSAALPEVLVLAPEEMAGASGWPEFGAAAVTDEARRRGGMYAARRRRQAAGRGFGGGRGGVPGAAGTPGGPGPGPPAGPAPPPRACTSCPRVPGSSTRPGRPREKQSSRRGSPRRTPTWPPSGSVTPSATTESWEPA